MGNLILLVLPIVLLLVLVSRGRKQQQRVASLQTTLAPGQRVVTTAGLYARVVEVDDTTVVLEPADGVRTTWARQAVARRVEDAVEHDVRQDAPAPPPGPAPPDLRERPAAPTSEPTSRPAGATAADPDAPERPER